MHDLVFFGAVGDRAVNIVVPLIADAELLHGAHVHFHVVAEANH